MCQQLTGDLKHTQNYRNFSHVEIPFFPVVEIPIMHLSLCFVVVVIFIICLQSIIESTTQGNYLDENDR